MQLFWLVLQTGLVILIQLWKHHLTMTTSCTHIISMLAHTSLVLEMHLDAGLPVFISEYGFVSADGDGSVDTKEAAKWQDIIDEYQLSSCIWNLSNKAEGSALISSDCDKTADWEEDELSEQGQYFFDMLTTIDTSKQDDEEISDETSEDIKEKEQKLNKEKSNLEKKR